MSESRNGHPTVGHVGGLRRGDRLRGYAVHTLTASGVVAAMLATGAAADKRPRLVFALLVAAVLIDAADGPLARRWHVKTSAPAIDGRTIDDLVDYLTFTFVPLLLVWRMGWVPGETLGVLWVIPPLIASLFGFAHVTAKDEKGGFFRGFPSYWNVAAFYLGLSVAGLGEPGRWLNGLVLLTLAGLTIAPIGFLYPNLTPPPWRLPVLLGAAVWLTMLGAMLILYPAVPPWVTGLSLIYPLAYTGLSVTLWWRHRRTQVAT